MKPPGQEKQVLNNASLYQDLFDAAICWWE